MKAKGLVVKPLPEFWSKWQNPDKPNDYFTKEEIEFNNKLLIEKRPYFMYYLYPTYKSKYKAHYEKYDFLCYKTFGLHIEELQKVINKTEDQQRLVDNYNKFSPLIDSNCPMNNVCHYMESKVKEVKINVKKPSPDYIFDILFNKKIKITEEEIAEMDKVFKSYKKSNRKSIKQGIYLSEDSDMLVSKQDNVEFLKFDYISKDIQKLANLAVYINYYLYPKSNKNFCWDLFGEGIILNIFDNSNKEFSIPVRNDNGDIEYMGKRYKNERVEIVCQ